MCNSSSHFFIHDHLIFLECQFYLENHGWCLWLALGCSLDPGLVLDLGWWSTVKIVHGTRVRLLKSSISSNIKVLILHPWLNLQNLFKLKPQLFKKVYFLIVCKLIIESL